ncbi:Ig-like domain-containing protein [Paenibacillus agricola]|uniref:BIG2 domain-containing protein n=1 Tax=Paenibacillus agricola TaxID=2716264 RepID=A0ABX0JGG3_9BACL|nr:Ig-like domain-containing protein [Paenibacillus agricola]NHN34291.1 hypothetical protein [Paenibacillus agricola]
MFRKFKVAFIAMISLVLCILPILNGNVAAMAAGPAVTSVSVPANGTYVMGDTLIFTVNFDKPVTLILTNAPQLSVLSGYLSFGPTYISGSGTANWVFSHTIDQEGYESGITIQPFMLLNDSTIEDSYHQSYDGTLSGIQDTSGILLDTIPKVSSVSVPPSGTYGTGDHLDFRVTYTSNVEVYTNNGIPSLELVIGTSKVQANYVSAASSTQLDFRYTVQSTDEDTDGIVLNSINLNEGSIGCCGEGAANNVLHNVGSTTGVLVNVRATLTGLNLDSASYSLAIGGTHQTVATAVYSDASTFVLSSGAGYSSSNTSAASVDSQGLVTAVAAGQTVITATYQGQQAQATVTVSPAGLQPTLTGLTLDSTGYRLAIGGTHQTVTTAVNSDASTFVLSSGAGYASSDTSVASIDSQGLVTAAAAGQTVITATYQGQHAQAAVTVYRSSSGSSGSSSPSSSSNIGIEVIVDGVKQEQSATAKTESVGGHSVTTITVDNDKVLDKLEKDNNKVLTIPVSGIHSDVIVTELRGHLIKATEAKDAVIQIVTDKATYMVPASLINIDSIYAQLGNSVPFEDIKVQIEIGTSTADTVKIVENAAVTGEFVIVVPPTRLYN